MADAVKNIVVNFEVNDTQLQDSIDLLVQQGKIAQDNAALIKQAAASNVKSEELQTASVDKLKKSLQDLYKVSAHDVQLGIADALVDAGVSAEDFEKALKDANKEVGNTGKAADSSKARLRAMKEELIRLTEAGQTGTAAFKKLQAEAGHLSDTIGDVGKRIKETGSDTHVFDGLISAAQGVAGGFAVVQGATALFGDESEALQETLVKVNSAMAILQGLQQVQNVLQKESAAALLFQSEAQIANTAATEGATIAQRAYNLVMSFCNPVVLIAVAALTAITLAYKLFTAESKEAAEAQEQFNREIIERNKLQDQFEESFKKDAEIRALQLKAQGKSDSRIRAAQIQENINALQRAQEALTKVEIDGEANRTKLKNTKDADETKRLQIADAEYQKFIDRRDAAQEELLKSQLQDEIATQAEIDKAKADAAAKEKKRQEDALKARKDAIKDEIAGLQLQQTRFKENQEGYRELQVKINDLEKSLKNLDATGNQALLNIREAQIANQKLFTDAIVKADSELEVHAEDRRKTELTSLKGLASDISKVEKQITDNSEAERQKRLKKVADMTALVGNYLNQAAQTLGQFFEQESQRQIDSLERQKDKIKDLVDAGEITEKEAKNRTRRIDAEEKRIQTEQARRAKAIAIFQAIVNTASAVTKALAEAGPLLAIVVGALGAAQVALIASRPIPKFAKGKKAGGYEGIGLIGEAGPEFHQTSSGMYLADKPTVTYLGRGDVVYNAAETKRMLEDGPQLSRRYQLYQNKHKDISLNAQFDYKKFGAAVGEHVQSNILNVTEKGLETIARKNLEWTKYIGGRRGL